MDSHIEKELILVFGDKKIDVSNVSVGQKHRGLTVWNAEVLNKEATVESVNSMVDEVGLLLIKQSYDILRIRFGRVKSFIESAKRAMFSKKLISKCNTYQYEQFQSWVYEQITGKKKENLQTDSDLMTMTRNLYRKAEVEQNLNQEQVLELLMMSVKDQMKHLKQYTDDQKKL